MFEVLDEDRTFGLRDTFLGEVSLRWPFWDTAPPAPLTELLDGSEGKLKSGDVTDTQQLEGGDGVADTATRRVVADFWQNFGKFRSFSAVSAPIFTTKYAF